VIPGVYAELAQSKEAAIERMLGRLIEKHFFVTV